MIIGPDINSSTLKWFLSSFLMHRIKYHVNLLWEEFKLPIWVIHIFILAFRSQSSKFFTNLSLKVTEFDWNGNGNAEWGDHSVHAEQLSNFYRLMFSHEVFLIQSYDKICLVLVWSQGIHKACLYLSSQFWVLKMKKSKIQSELLVHEILNLWNVFASCFPFFGTDWKRGGPVKNTLSKCSEKFPGC